MAYSKHTWVNGTTPALNETNLNEMETGIEDAHDDLVTHAALDTGVHGAGSDVLVTDADIATHAALDTGVHGAGASTLATAANITTHAALTTGVHGVTGTILGTEDKDVAGGVAELDGDGSILSQGSYVKIVKSGGNAFYLYNRTDSEAFIRFTRLGTNDYKADMFESSAWQRIQTASMKYVNNGITGWVSPPASSSSTGTTGQMAYDSSYFYVCTATDTWKRVAIASW